VWQTVLYSNAIDNLKVEISARKSAQNLQVTCAEFAILAQNSDSPIIKVNGRGEI